jgi:hypothetical protein
MSATGVALLLARAKGHYSALRSTDLKHWEDVSPQRSMPKGILHGTAFKVTGKMVEAPMR